MELRQSWCELCIRKAICWQICWHLSVFRSCQLEKLLTSSSLKLAPEVGFEPTTNRLTADRSTTELLWNPSRLKVYMLPSRFGAASANRLIPTASGLYH